MKTITVAGVPEHFNMPWHLCIEDNSFAKEGISILWKDVPEGTGKMCNMLRNEETDLAIVLTEGIVKDIGEGNSSKIIQKFIESPLLWGVHTAYNSKLTEEKELENKKIAISRFGSGSHLMAHIHASKFNWKLSHDQFVIVNTLNGAVDALTSGEADYFLWEKFMTQPLIDTKIFKRIGICPTPWPCFAIVASKNAITTKLDDIKKIVSLINNKTAKFKEDKSNVKHIALKYHLEPYFVEEWLQKTVWSQKHFTELELNKVQNQLLALNLINKKSTFAQLALNI